MRLRTIGVAFAAMMLAANPAAAVPDESFSQAHVAYMEAKVAELLAPYAATGGASDEQFHQAWCRAAYFWKLANPGGEAKLTLKVLLQFRHLQWRCGQKLKRAAPLPGEGVVTPPPTTPPPPPPGEPDSEGADEAVEDFMRWHPEEFTDAPSETEYIERRIFWWERMGEGRDLLERLNAEQKAMNEALNDRDLERQMSPEAYEQMRQAMQKAVDEAAAAYEAAQAAEIAKARAEWAAKHPDAPRDFDGELGDPVAQGQGAGAYYRNAEPDPYPVEFEALNPDQQREQAEWERRTSAGSVDPLDQQAWAQASQPIVVGPNDRVGSDAQLRQQVLGAAAGMLGVGGGGETPTLARCRVDAKRMQSFTDPRSGVALKVSAQRSGATMTVFALIDDSPDQGTFQTAFLETLQGERQAPRNVGICRLYGQWSLSVSWTRSTYRDGALAGRETGGWTRQGAIPGLDVPSDGAPDGLWRRLGFSNASRGAQMASFAFQVPPGQLATGQTGLVVHVTRPGQDPVTTAPFVLRVREGPQGFNFEQVVAP